MEYIIDPRVISKLLEVESKILESYRLIAILKDLPTDKEIKEIQRLKVLVKKENILINQLPQNSEILKYICNIVCQNQQNFFEDDNIAILVLNRFENIMIDNINLLMDQEDEELFEDEDFEIDDFEKMSIRIAIRDNVYQKYLKSLNELMKLYDKSFKSTFTNAQYSISFYYKNVGDYVLANDFNIDKINFYSDNFLFQKLNLTFEDYNEIKNDELYEMTQNVFFTMISNIYSQDNAKANSKLIDDSLLFKFLLHEMNTATLLTFSELVHENIEKVDSEDKLLKQILDIVEAEKNRRDDIPKDEVEPNPLIQCVDEKTVDNLIKLIKIDEQMLEVFERIDLDKENNDDYIKELSILTDIEKEIIKKINVNYKTDEIVEKMLFNDLDLFLRQEESPEIQEWKFDLIYNRIHNILPFFKKKVLSPTQSEASYSYIDQNHLVSTLKTYEILIEKMQDSDRREYLKEMHKELFFINGRLMDDLIFINGNYKMIDTLSDDVSSKIVGLSDIEYMYDKDEQLYEYAKELIEDVFSYEDKWEEDLSLWSLFEFKLLELNDIIKNISDEHIYELPDIIKENDNCNSRKSKKRILRIINKRKVGGK